MSKPAPAAGLLFLNTGVGTNAFGQLLGTRKESEVPIMGSEILYVQASSGAGGRFFKDACVGKSFRTNLGHKTGK